MKEYFTVRLFEKDFHPREWGLNKVYNNYLIQEPVYVYITKVLFISAYKAEGWLTINF